MVAYKNFAERVRAIPIGYSTGQFQDRTYGITRAESQQGKAVNLQAHELGGQDYISFNLYELENRKRLLKPCEMPEPKVIDFIMGLEPVTPK